MTPNFIRFTAEPAPEGLIVELGAIRINVWSTQPFGHNASVRAWVGAVEMVGINIDQFGLSFQGYLPAMPAIDATLSVQINGGEKVDTELTVDTASNLPDPEDRG